MTADSEVDRAADSPAPLRGRRRLRPQLWSSRNPLLGPVVILAAVALIASGVMAWVSSPGAQRDVAPPTWFAGYVDVTLSPGYPFETGAASDVVLAFVVASPQEPCTPSWGTHYGLDAAARELNLDHRLEDLGAQGGRAAVAFGGSLNLELANSCRDEAALASAYRQVLERYNPVALDFDIEGDNLLDTAAGKRRAKVVGELLREQAALGRRFEVWLTLPASPEGLGGAGITAVDQMLDAGVQLAGVNVMTMNYGQSRPVSQSMLEASISAATAVHAQLGAAYRRAGVSLDSRQLWHRMGLTPMIGQNDLPGEIFDLAAAQGIRDFAVANGAQRLSMWSLNRDMPCQAADSGPETASHICSGVAQRTGQFSELLGGGLKGRMG